MPEDQVPVSGRFHDIVQVIAPALLLGLNILVFGTFFVFNQNQGEFLVPYADALYRYYVPAIVIVIAIGLLPLAMNKRANRNFNAVIILLGLMTYLHGNLLLWDTGILDGSQLDLSKTWRSIVDALLWVALAWLVFHHRHWLAIHGWKICIVLIIFQVIGVISVYDTEREPTPPDMFIFPDELAHFSSDTNVIHIILDGFQANIFDQLLAENPDLNDHFTGFTFFKDATTPSDVTYLSVPATLTGKTFKNEQTISEYHQETLHGDNLYSFLANQGFDIDVATPLWWNKARPFFSSYFRIPAPYSNEQDTLLSTALLVADVSLYRASPHFFKHVIYRSGSWLLSSKFVPDPAQQFEHFAHDRFLVDLQNRMSVTSTKPRYKFIHLVTPHAPFVTMPDCEFSGSALEYGKEAFLQQSRCILKTVAAFLDQLEAHGIYDNSIVIIHGDHGGGVPFELLLDNGERVTSSEALHRVWGNPLPLVLIKTPGARGGIEVSDKQVQLTDVPVTVARQLGISSNFPGNPMFGDNRAGVDRFYFYSTMHRNEAAAKDSFDQMTSYKISGSVYELSSWQEFESFSAPVLDTADNYTWGTDIQFGRRGNSLPFQTSGWAMTSADMMVWTEGHAASLSIKFPPAENPVGMRANIKPLTTPGKLDSQRVEIYVGGKKAGTWSVTGNKFQDMVLTIPRNLLNQGRETEIRFELPDARSPESLGTGRDTRVLALAFFSIKFEQEQDSQPGNPD